MFELAVALSPDLPPEPALQAAAGLCLPFVGVVSEPRRCDLSRLLLWQTPDGWCLQQTGKAAPGPVRVDFTDGKARHRRLHGGGRGQLVAKALGLHKGHRPSVLDATAGLGQDAFVLASLGCRITLLERSPVTHWLLADGLARGLLTGNAEEVTILSRMQLLHADGIDWLSAQSGPVADVVYLDPMFPHREKTALVKKEMRLFRDIVGQDEDAARLLAAALAKARCRVVVKRPRKAPPVEGVAPGVVLEGESSRFDLYPLQALD